MPLGPERRSDWLESAIDALATYRLTRLVVDDEITDPLRGRIWERFNPSSTKIGYLISCPWCVSIWAGVAVVAARRLIPDTWDPLARALASSAASGMIATRL